jgi:adenosine 3'-phospho 5'-phosphosulfate transporter B3
MRDYVQLSVWTMTGMYFTNWSLTYLNYPMRILAKSSKVIPVMIVGMIVQGRYYTRLEYFSAFVLAAGITLFTMGDMYDSPRFDIRGLILISLGVFADAMTANFEEARLFKTHKCSPAEVMLFSSAFSAIWTLATMFGSNELFDAVEHAKDNNEVLSWTIMSATMGYSSVAFVLLLIKRFGATNAEIVKSCRKVLSIIISFVAFGKTVGNFHVLGGVLFTLSVALGVHIKTRKMAAKREARKNRKDGVVEEEEEYHGGGV